MEAKDEKKLKNYEMTYLSSAGDPVSVRDAIVTGGGVILEMNEPVKVRLEYPIRKALMAFLGVAKFEVEPGKVKNVSAGLRLKSEDVLRFIVTNPIVGSMRKPQPAEDFASPAGDRNRKTAPGAERTTTRSARIEELTNEALEKKIEEILK